MRTAAASPTIEFVNAAGTAVTTPAALTLKSKPLWVGISPVYTANTLPFPANTAIALIGANTLTMSADALTAGTWAYGPGIKRLK